MPPGIGQNSMVMRDRMRGDDIPRGRRRCYQTRVHVTPARGGACPPTHCIPFCVATMAALELAREDVDAFQSRVLDLVTAILSTTPPPPSVPSKSKQCTEIHSYVHMPVSRAYMRA